MSDKSIIVPINIVRCSHKMGYFELVPVNIEGFNFICFVRDNAYISAEEYFELEFLIDFPSSILDMYTDAIFKRNKKY